jgi:hypothetical protein
MTLIPFGKKTVPAVAKVPALRTEGQVAAVGYNAGSAVPVTFGEQAGAPDFSRPQESFVSGFALRRYQAAAPTKYGAATANSRAVEADGSSPMP